MKILVIDDNRDLLEMVSYILGLSGHHVIKASCGMTGIEQACRQKPDLVLLDIMMPGFDGFQTCQKLKSNPRTRCIPVFMLTALEKISDVEKAFKTGADDYITKPFDNDQLNDIICRKLNRYKSQV